MTAVQGNKHTRVPATYHHRGWTIKDLPMRASPEGYGNRLYRGNSIDSPHNSIRPAHFVVGQLVYPENVLQYLSITLLRLGTVQYHSQDGLEPSKISVDTTLA